jgi:uracil-DNA glycosylase family 4
VPGHEAPRDCPLCPRLVAFRHDLRTEHPDWWNAPVPHFGDPQAWLAICGLAPGKHGANRTGRPFTGDFAGLLLYETLLKFGLAAGDYREEPDDGLRLTGVAIVNSVKCVPPQNKPTPDEIATCTSTYFRPALAALPKVRLLVAEHLLPDGRLLIDSYHCSRYNQNTNRLTRAMFEDVFARALELREAELSSAVHLAPPKPGA